MSPDPSSRFLCTEDSFAILLSSRPAGDKIQNIEFAKGEDDTAPLIVAATVEGFDSDP